MPSYRQITSILEELVNDSHPFQKTFEENELIDFSHTHPTELPFIEGKIQNMAFEKSNITHKGRISVIGFLYQFAGAYKQEANALTLVLSRLNSNKKQNVVDGYKVLLKVVDYHSDQLLKQLDEYPSSIYTLVKAMLFLSASYNKMQTSFTKTAKNQIGSIKHIFIKDAERLKKQGKDLNSKSSSFSDIQDLRKLLIGFYNDRATNFREMKMDKQIKKESTAVFMLEQHADILDKCTNSL